MEIESLGKIPISEEQPTGADVRYEPEYEELQAEIDKLSSPSASGEMDWSKVLKLSSEILSSKAKDLLVASYFSVAQIYVHHIEGFRTGLGVYRDLLETFWDDLFPKKKRMRGRIGAIEWWLEKSESALQSQKISPLSPEMFEGFKDDLKKIDRLLNEYLDDAPLLRSLERVIDQFPVKEEKKAEPEIGQEKDAAASSETQKVTSPQTQVASPKPSSPAVELTGTTDAEKSLRDALQNIRRISHFFQSNDLSDPRGYRWMRISGWSMIQALPPATDGNTQIPLPAEYEAVQNNLNDLKSKGNWEALIRGAEERLNSALLWLDLNRFVSEALDKLGDRYVDANNAVCQETAYLVHRIPGVENLAFSDGTPFCDAETKQWLSEIRFGGESATAPVAVGSSTGGDHMAETIDTALALAKKKKVGEAVSILQEALRSSDSKREKLLWRLGLLQVLSIGKKQKLARPHLESVLRDIDTYKLEEWDPGLALEGLKMVFSGYRTRSDETGKYEADEVLKRLALLDPVEALRF